MKMYKTQKIAVKVTGKIALGLLIVFIVLMFIIANSIKTDLVRREQDKLTLLATESASVAREFMESMLDKQSVLMNTLENLDHVEESNRVQTIKNIMSDIKREENNALSLFYIAEPNTLIQNSPNGYAVFATNAGTQTASDMYQYVNKESYEQVKSNKQMTIVDPFSKNIDGVEYMVITVVLPILNDGNEFIVQALQKQNLMCRL